MTVTLYQGDCLEVMATLPADSVDSMITDPPAGISFMGKEWDSDKGGAEAWIDWLTDVMRAAYRVLKPGGAILVWSIPRTSHWTGTAIERAGFQVVDVITHLFGSGFPKSLDIGKAIDKAAGAEREVVGERTLTGSAAYKNGDGGNYGMRGVRGAKTVHVTAPATVAAQQWDGWGTALKPAAEFWWLAYKPREGTFAANALAWGVAGLNIDGGRIGTNGRPHIEKTGDRSPGTSFDTLHSRAVGTTTTGRWPANVILDDEAARALDEQSGERPGASSNSNGRTTAFASGRPSETVVGYGDTGGASRFYYCAKASRKERNLGLEGMPEQPAHPSGNQWATTSMWNGENGDEAWRKKNPNKPQANHHPTVKPLALMRYLCRLTKTPTGGVVLDPFMGSGTTGMAAVMEGRDFIGIELDGDYLEIARRRITAAAEQARQLALTLE